MNTWNGKGIAEELVKNFRITKEQFDALADELSSYISADPSSPRMGLSVEKKLAITLHLLKDTGSIIVTTMHLEFVLLLYQKKLEVCVMQSILI